MSSAPWLIVYSVFVVVASLAGGWLPTLVRLTHARMQSLVSLVAGLMLGVGLFHLLPHSAIELRSIDRAVVWTMIGLLTTFLLIRAFHFHQHEPAEVVDLPVAPHEHLHSPGCGHEHDHDHDRPRQTSAAEHHGAAAPHGPAGASQHRLSWVGIGLGLTIHTLLDGAALAASVAAEAHPGHEAWLPGLGTFLAIVLHKPLDSLSITALMAAGGWSSGSRRLVNLAYSLMCPAGVLIFWSGIRAAGAAHEGFVGAALAFSAGVFLCISLADLLPEVQFHSHDRLKLSAFLLLGVLMAWGIRYLEPAGTHGDETLQDVLNDRSHDRHARE